MSSITIPTFYADIYLGLRKGYAKEIIPMDYVRNICDEFVADGFCVTLQDIEYIYTGGGEPGVKIGMINYPRFPKTEFEILLKAHNLAYILLERCSQFRCTIITPKETFLLENQNMSVEFIDQ